MRELLLILGFSLTAGSLIGLGFAQTDLMQEEKDSDVETEDEYVLGSAHEHALFYVSVEGEETSFLEDRYQLAAPHVHLENRKSHIVHKHAENVTWGDFLDTIGMSLDQRDGEICLEVKDIDRCGEGSVFQSNSSGLELDRLIRQGDKFIVALGENSSAELEELRDRELPEDYTPGATPGRRV